MTRRSDPMLDLAALIMAEARLSGASVPTVSLVRRCLVHHVPLEELVCPTGKHPTVRERLFLGQATYHGVFEWEIYNERTGLVEGRVLDEFRVEWVEDPDEVDRLHIVGRHTNGLAEGKFTRPHAGGPYGGPGGTWKKKRHFVRQMRHRVDRRRSGDAA